MESQQQQYGGRMPYFYSPEGSLVQVDFALEAVNRGSTTLGIKTNEVAILASQLKPTRPLIDPSEKVFSIDDHVGATGAGYIGDVLKLIQELRVEAQKHNLTFGSPIDVKTAAETLSSYLHQYTIYAVRPLGASVIMAGKDPTGVVVGEPAKPPFLGPQPQVTLEIAEPLAVRKLRAVPDDALPGGRCAGRIDAEP